MSGLCCQTSQSRSCLFSLISKYIYPVTPQVVAHVTLPSPPLKLFLNFQGSCQKPPSSRRCFSDPFWMNVPSCAFLQQIVCEFVCSFIYHSFNSTFHHTAGYMPLCPTESSTGKAQAESESALNPSLSPRPCMFQTLNKRHVAMK